VEDGPAGVWNYSGESRTSTTVNLEVCALAEQYFTPSPTSARQPQAVRYRMRDGRELVFQTDAGVFSKGRVDRGTLELIKAIQDEDGQSFLDLGCGWGPVGIVAALSQPRREVWMVDINERACELARANALANGAGRAIVVCGDGLAAVRGRKFDVIATNPPIRAGKSVVYRLVEEARDHLNEGGRFYAVARTKQGAGSLRVFICEAFGNADEPEIGGGYRVIRATR